MKAGLSTISSGIGYGPLGTISDGFLGLSAEFFPGVALAILASPLTVFVVAVALSEAVQPAALTFALEPAPVATTTIAPTTSIAILQPALTQQAKP